jgi:drug/metabolite transporter (DMT)-like permease
MAQSPKTWTADALVLLAALIWGVAFYFQKAAMDHVGPLTFLGLRAIIAAAVLSPFALMERRGGKSVVPIALGGGCIFFVAASIQQIGIVEATVTNTGFLTALYVVFTPFIVWALRRKAPGAAIWVGAALAFIGTWALSGGSFAAFTRGDWLIAFSAIFWSCFIVTTGWSGKFATPLTYMGVQFMVVALLSFAAAFTFETPTLAAIQSGAVPILYVGILSSALTFGLLAVALRHVPPARAAILLSLETVFAAIAGAIMLGERLPAIGWAGAALMMAAILVVQLGKRGEG